MAMLLFPTLMHGKRIFAMDLLHAGLLYLWVAIPSIFFWTLVLIASWRAHHPKADTEQQTRQAQQ
jgi:hypothetical protein